MPNITISIDEALLKPRPEYAEAWLAKTAKV